MDRSIRNSGKRMGGEGRMEDDILIKVLIANFINFPRMESAINIQRIAVEIGDILKWSSSVNEINRSGQAILKVSKEVFPNTAITSERQQEIYNWLCSLAAKDLLSDERCKMVVAFCTSLAKDEQRTAIIKVLETGGIPRNILFRDQLAILDRANLHSDVYRHAKESFQYEKYSHALLEVFKAYDKALQTKTGLEKSGRSLVQEAWSWKASILRVTTGTTESDESFHDGLRLFSEGATAGIRNISAHEPILTWPINKEDCIDILHLASYLFRKLDKAVNLRGL